MLQGRTTWGVIPSSVKLEGFAQEFLRLRHEIPGMRSLENGFGKSGKQRIEDKASKNQAGQHRAGIRSRAERREAETPSTNAIKIPRSIGMPMVAGAASL